MIIQLMKQQPSAIVKYSKQLIIMHKSADFFFKSTSDLHKNIPRLMLCTFVG